MSRRKRSDPYAVYEDDPDSFFEAIQSTLAGVGSFDVAVAFVEETITHSDVLDPSFGEVDSGYEDVGSSLAKIFVKENGPNWKSFSKFVLSWILSPANYSKAVARGMIGEIPKSGLHYLYASLQEVAETNSKYRYEANMFLSQIKDRVIATD